jgi:hypothetical protein
MDEQRWLDCTNLDEMLTFATDRPTVKRIIALSFASLVGIRRPLCRPRASERKLRLFCCACCRRVWHWLPDERSRRAVETIERFVDGRATQEELEAATAESDSAHRDIPEGNVEQREAALAALWAAEWFSLKVPGEEVEHVVHSLHRAFQDDRAALAAEQAAQCELLREVVGNPFSTLSADPAWLRWKGGMVKVMGDSIYDQRRYEDLPVLADALEDAGCDNPDILAHCRSAGPHVRGCWVLDLLLARA